MPIRYQPNNSKHYIVLKELYIHKKPCGEIFYVGIGTPKRSKSKVSRNPFWHNIVEKHGYEVEVLMTGLDSDTACKLEIDLISHLGRRDLGRGTLVNLTDGGEGTPGLVQSEYQRKLSSEKFKLYNSKPRSETYLLAQSKGKGNPIDQYDLNGNLIKSWYASSQAARELGIVKSGILRSLPKSRPYKGFIWKLKE